MLHISTHSRAKAAGGRQALCGARKHDFNSQPREGGWPVAFTPETPSAISTHSRAKAAGSSASPDFHFSGHFNSQPREGGWLRLFRLPKKRCHFNSQPREGGWKLQCVFIHLVDDFNSQPREGGWAVTISFRLLRTEFQLTAARRRLEFKLLCHFHSPSISTHSRAKAAGQNRAAMRRRPDNFNSQPREGGWNALRMWLG